MVSQRLQDNREKEKEVASAASLLDFVIPYVRSGDGGQELRVALSTLKNVGDWSGKVWIVGDYESWFEDLIGLTHLPSPRADIKWVGIQTALLIACEHPDVSERFYYSNDDIYVNVPFAHIPPLYKDTWAEDDYYGNTVQETRKWLMSQNISDPLNYEPHTPLPVVKTDFREILRYCLKHAETRIPLQVRTAYGNFFNIGGELFEDKKSMHGEEITGDIISSDQYQEWIERL